VVDVDDVGRVLQRQAADRPPSDDVRLRDLRRRDGGHGLSDTLNPARRHRTILPILWTIGAIMVCVGGYWFWFFIRVDVAAEGNSAVSHHPRGSVRAVVGRERHGCADLGVSARRGNVLLANIFLGLYLIATTVLFGSVPWSKFAHHVLQAGCGVAKAGRGGVGLRRNLPEPVDKPKTLGDPRRRPNHY